MSATVQNEQGIHCRPSAAIVKKIGRYAGVILIEANEVTCDARSIMGLLALGLQRGDSVVLRVSGPDEKNVCLKLVELFETVFDFPLREQGQSTERLLDELTGDDGSWTKS